MTCRVVPPATLQLIWHAVPRRASYHVEIRRIQARGDTVTTTVATSDTTWTQAGLPSGLLRIRVVESEARYWAVSVPVSGDRPVACRSAPAP